VLGPKMSAIDGIDQLPGYAYPFPRLADRAFQHITYAKFAADLLHIHCPTLVGKARIASDHKEPTDTAERRRYLLDHAVGKVLLFGIAAHVLKGQDGDRWHVRKREGSLPRPQRRLPLAGISEDAVNVYGPTDVLQSSLAEVLDIERELAARVI